MKIRKTMLMAALVTLAIVYGGTAQANVASGSLWHVPEAVVNSATGATPANVPVTPADATFDVNSPLNFSATGASVATWLSSGGAFNVTASAATLSSLMDPSIVEFKGLVSVTTGQTFNVQHDDGLTLIINGLTVVNAPGPTSPILTTGTYTGATGTWAFDLVYAECCGGPAVLAVDLPFQSVPEPASGLLILTGIVGLLGYGWRKRQQTA